MKAWKLNELLRSDDMHLFRAQSKTYKIIYFC